MNLKEDTNIIETPLDIQAEQQNNKSSKQSHFINL